jgi:hypothetical protein
VRLRPLAVPVLPSHALPALAASVMLYLSSLLLTAAAAALLFHA